MESKSLLEATTSLRWMHIEFIFSQVIPWSYLEKNLQCRPFLQWVESSSKSVRVFVLCALLGEWSVAVEELGGGFRLVPLDMSPSVESCLLVN